MKQDRQNEGEDIRMHSKEKQVSESQGLCVFSHVWKLEEKTEKKGGRGTSQENERELSRVEERDWGWEKGMERRNTGEQYLPNYTAASCACTNVYQRIPPLWIIIMHQ